VEQHTVLVVEDDPDLRQSIQWVLEDEGLVVQTAANGREALARAVHQQPALVVLDPGLPILDGEAVAAGLREAYGEAVPILTITADDKGAEKARRVGALGYLPKPFDIDDLVSAVRRALGRRAA
jgi:DNA-binding response OmpR family regulator